MKEDKGSGGAAVGRRNLKETMNSGDFEFSGIFDEIFFTVIFFWNSEIFFLSFFFFEWIWNIDLGFGDWKKI